MAIVSAVHALAMAGTAGAEASAPGLRAARTQLAQLKDLSGWANVQARVALARASLLLGDRVGAETVLGRAVGSWCANPTRCGRPPGRRGERALRHLAGTRRGSSSLTTAELRVLRYLPTNLSLPRSVPGSTSPATP